MKYSVLDITPGPSLNKTLAEMAGRDEFEPIGIFFRAVADRRIGLTIVFSHRFAWTPRSIKTNLPRIVVISDDFGESRDPAEWRCAISAIAWSRTTVVHGTGAQVEHYQTALLAAELTGRSLFIETDSAHAPAWAAAIQPRENPCLLLRPPNGGVHPAEGALQ
jgi:hypothetical protein